MMKGFLLAFVPLFVAIDVIGVIPFYLGLVGGLDRPRKRRLLLQALATAWIGGFAFALLGTVTFNFLGITVADFKVAGGLILLVLSIYDLLFASASREPPSETAGVVPLGMPLIVGPAVLTTLLIQVDAVGLPMALAAFTVNLAVVLGVFLIARRIGALVGQGGMAAVSKISSLLLAAIAVMMIRRGITEIVHALT
jgi:multiple antibiotic resistance protein